MSEFMGINEEINTNTLLYDLPHRLQSDLLQIRLLHSFMLQNVSTQQAGSCLQVNSVPIQSLLPICWDAVKFSLHRRRKRWRHLAPQQCGLFDSTPVRIQVLAQREDHFINS